MTYIYSMDATFSIHQLLVRQSVTSARFAVYAYTASLLVQLHGEKLKIFPYWLHEGIQWK